ncbi:MAG: AAA family ATPase [Ferrimicrobium acidiphilum]
MAQDIRNTALFEKSYKSRSIQQRLFACAIDANVPIFMLGAPGVGKTEFVSSFAERNDYTFELLAGPQLEPGDVVGLPVEASDEDGEFATKFARMEWITRLNKAEKAILFIDELPLASDETKKALLSIIQGRKAGTHRLGDHVRIVAAGNPLAWSFETIPLSAPMRTRLLHINWEPDVDEWVENFHNGFADWTPPSIPAGVKRMSRDVLNQLRGIMFQHKNLIQAATINNVGPEAPFNVMRSWNNVYQVARFIPAGDYSTLHAAMCGLVGESIAQEVSALLRYQLPIDEIIADPTSFDWENESGDRVYAALLSVTDRALDKSFRDVSHERAANILQVVAKHGCADIAWVFLVKLLEEVPNFKLSQSVAKTFQSFLED